jgi:hypothetical protein
MRSVAADKVIVKRDADQHYVYFSVRDERDDGSIIDFAMRRKGLNLGQVRKELRRGSACRPRCSLRRVFPAACGSMRLATLSSRISILGLVRL